MKVKLTVDLTRYHPKLIPGIEGHTCSPQSFWAGGSDRFTGVNFGPDIGALDILWRSLKIVDEKVLQELDEEQRCFHHDLKTATNATWVTGPRRGFKHLSFTYLSSKPGDEGERHFSTGGKNEAEEIKSIFKEHGVQVKQVVQI